MTTRDVAPIAVGSESLGCASRCGRIREQKRRLVAAITRARVEEAGAKREEVTVVLHDSDDGGWAEGGALLAGREA